MTRSRWLVIAAVTGLAVLVAGLGRAHLPAVTPSPRPAPGTAAAAAVTVRLLAAVTDLDSAYPAPDWRTIAASATPSFAVALRGDAPRLTVGQMPGDRQRLTVTSTAVQVRRYSAVVQVVGTLTVSGRDNIRVAVAWTCRLVADGSGWRVAGLA